MCEQHKGKSFSRLLLIVYLWLLMSKKKQEMDKFLMCEILQETATDGVNLKNVILDKSKNMEVVKKGSSGDGRLDGAQQKSDEEDVKKDCNLCDWRTAIQSKPKIKQPGGQGDDLLNQTYLFSKVGFNLSK